MYIVYCIQFSAQSKPCFVFGSVRLWRAAPEREILGGWDQSYWLPRQRFGSWEAWISFSAADACGWLMILRHRGSCQDGRPKSRGDPWDILGRDSSSSTIHKLLKKCNARGKLNGFSQGSFYWNFIPLPEAPLSRLSLWWLNQQYLRWRAVKVGYLLGSFSGP